jgi:hypothetical protein
VATSAFIAAGVVALGVLVFAVWFGWVKYQGWKSAKNRERVEAEEAKRDAPMKNCIAAKLPAKPDVFDQASAEEECSKVVSSSGETLAQACADWESKHPLGSPVDVLHGKWDDGTPMPKEGVTLGTPQGCSGPLEDAYNLKLDSQKHSLRGVDCFDKTSGKKTKDFFAEVGGVTTTCGPNFIQKPAGLCKELAALSDKSHAPDCASGTIIDLSAGMVSKQ